MGKYINFLFPEEVVSYFKKEIIWEDVFILRAGAKSEWQENHSLVVMGGGRRRGGILCTGEQVGLRYENG